ncbi:MAG: class I mannose-6-phosphate isomerase [Actinomycetota bacterium]
MSETPMHLRNRRPNYDRFPAVPAGSSGECIQGWNAIAAKIRARNPRVVVIESYPGVRAWDIESLAASLCFAHTVNAAEALKPVEQIEALVQPDVTDDPVFGRLTHLRIEEFFDPVALSALQDQVARATEPVVVHGVGASLIARGDVVVYADMARWETQMRMRGGEFSNLGADNASIRWQDRYKRAYFVDWRVADRLKKSVWNRVDFVLDTIDPSAPKMIEAASMFRALRNAARAPFRVVPYFDPAPWGGKWMQQVCDLDPDVPNYGWCFDCVPEENSLLLAYGPDLRFEVPSQNLVYAEPKALLGESVYGRFGDEFPIRFDFLDTMEGGNLSLQVHPLTEYIQDQFGMHYTQDESYYILDAEPGLAHVYLGVREGVDQAAMLADLRRAERGEISFPAETYVNKFPAKTHDHFLIPAGTLHCSSRCMVLEISATPYIFTFKLWDWDRPGLDGLPRPVHIDHGEKVIQWNRDTGYAQRRLINQVRPLAEGDGWREERTGLHEAEFIETRRHWFTRRAPHAALDRVCVLNLVKGEEAVVESPDGAFDPYLVHYAETFIVPAAAGPFTITPLRGGEECATIKAFVRTDP